MSLRGPGICTVLLHLHGFRRRPFAADHGPTGEDGTRFHERVIVVQVGAHHGWPRVIGAPGFPEYVDPILTFVPSAPPGDLLFYDADLMPQFRGDLFVSILGFQPAAAQALLRVRFQDPDRPQFPTAMERWFTDGEGNSVHGRLRGMTVGPDGALYVDTSNRDGRQLARETIRRMTIASSGSCPGETAPSVRFRRGRCAGVAPLRT